MVLFQAISKMQNLQLFRSLKIADKLSVFAGSFATIALLSALTYCSFAQGAVFSRNILFLCQQTKVITFVLISAVLIGGFMWKYDRIPVKSQPMHALTIVPTLQPIGALIWGAFWWERGLCWQLEVLTPWFIANFVFACLLIALYRGQRLFFLLWFLNLSWFCYLCWGIASMAIHGTWL